MRVRDVWTLEPGIGFGRTGGENKSRIRLADENFLGFGQNLALEYKSNVDRSGIGIQFTDPNVFDSWWGLTAHYAEQQRRLGLQRRRSRGPFYSLDSRWSAGVAGQSIEQVTSLYDLGETITEFDSRYETRQRPGRHLQGPRRRLDAALARRLPLRPRPVRPRRRTSTAPVPAGGPHAVLSVGRDWSSIQNNYITTENQDQIGRTEDVFLGDRLQASLGWSTPALGADGSAGIYSFSGNFGLPLFGKATSCC